METMDVLADTRRYLDDATRQLEAINAGVPIAKPLTRDEALNIVTEMSKYPPAKPGALRLGAP